jgi:hypothetical protein
MWNKLIDSKSLFRTIFRRSYLAEAQTNNPTATKHTENRYWTPKQILTDAVILALGGAAAYLQYYLYPLVMARPLNSTAGLGFGETNISLKFSFLTFQYTATRCIGGNCTRLVGIPSFDFFQALIISLVILNIVHFANSRKK